MKKNLMVVVVLMSAISSAMAAGPGPAWAWDAGKITNNGSVQITSSNGTSTYNAVQNPTGAVAKVNQSALTQPPTVIIQATSGGYSEAVPILSAGTTVLPTCPAGYTRVFATSGTGCPLSTYNIAGTRWNLINVPYSGDFRVMFVADQTLYYNANGTATVAPAGTITNTNSTGTAQCWVSGSAYSWAAALCTK